MERRKQDDIGPLFDPLDADLFIRHGYGDLVGLETTGPATEAITVNDDVDEEMLRRYEQAAEQSDSPPSNETDASVESRYQELLHVLHNRSRSSTDLVQRGLFKELMSQLPENRWLQETFRLYVKLRPDDKMPARLRQITTCFQEMVMELPDIPKAKLFDTSTVRDPRYPKGYDQPWRWRPAFNHLLTDEPQQWDFRLNLIVSELQSNVFSRFAPLRVTPQLFGQLSINLYSGGVSSMHVEALEMYYGKGRFPLKPYVVGSRDERNAYRFRPIPSSTAAFNRLLDDERFEIKSVCGSDLHPPTEPRALRHMISNSHRASELFDKDHQWIFKFLMNNPPENTKVMASDFSSKDHVHDVRREFPEWFELPNRWVQFVTSRYNLTDDQVKQSEENARLLAGDDGHILFQDFVHKGIDGRLYHPKPDEEWQAGDYNTYVIPPGSDEPLHIWQMMDGRATELIRGEDLPAIRRSIMRKRSRQG